MNSILRIPAVFSLVVICFMTPFRKNQEIRKAYRMTETAPRSEIDAGFLEKIDSIPPPFPADGPYQIGDIPTVPGAFTVCKFVAVYQGESALGRRDFHDLLVIQTDGSGEIVDACHYTLEWTDVPSLDLFRFQGRDVFLKNKLSIRDLNLVNIRTREVLDEDGTILIKD